MFGDQSQQATFIQYKRILAEEELQETEARSVVQMQN